MTAAHSDCDASYLSTKENTEQKVKPPRENVLHCCRHTISISISLSWQCQVLNEVKGGTVKAVTR